MIMKKESKIVNRFLPEFILAKAGAGMTRKAKGMIVKKESKIINRFLPTQE